MGFGDIAPASSGSHRKKPLTAAQRRRMHAAFRAVPAIQRLSTTAAEEEARIADQLLETYFTDNHAQNQDSRDPRTRLRQPTQTPGAPRERDEHSPA